MSRLYIIPTPIGNLADMTFRAVETLKKVDLILAEDTRTSGLLLNHYHIPIPLKAYHQNNEHAITPKIVEELKTSEKEFALITDAGTPGISDPGFLLVRECLKERVNVECLPGATAFIPALIKSGLPADRFVFEGFLPVKKGRNKRLNALKEEDRTLIFYESPHRLLKTITHFCEVFGDDRKASISRELTKIYEETVNGTLIELKVHFENIKPKGEFVIVVDGKK